MMFQDICSTKFYKKMFDLNLAFFEIKRSSIDFKIPLLLLLIVVNLVSFSINSRITKNIETNGYHSSKVSNSKSITKIQDNENKNKENSNKNPKPFGNLLNIFSDLFNNLKSKSNTKNKYECLNIPKNILNQKNFSLDKLNNKIKTEFFRKGKCNPVILIPGIFGSKLEFVLEDCKEFKKFHKNIMDSCGWDDCESAAFPKRFKIWLEIGAEKAIQKVMGNLKTNFFSFLNLNEKNKNGDTEDNKDKSETEYYIPSMLKYFDSNGNKIYFNNKPNTEKCFGNLFRLYYTKKESESQENKNDSTKNFIPKINLLNKLKGAEIRVLNESVEECGADATSDFGKPYSQYLSKSLLGFKSINQSLEKLGYIKGLSLFNTPYDFRFQIEHVIKKIQETVQLAYKINKKKVIVIGHSYGGLLTYKLSTLPEKELIEHSIAIGAPMLGSFQAVKNFFGIPEDFSYEKNLDIFGQKIGKIKTGFSQESMNIATASFNLLQFFPKEIKKDETFLLINKISEIENFYKSYHYKNTNDVKSLNKNKKNNENNRKKIGKNEPDKKRKKLSNDFLSLVQLEDKKTEKILRKFYEVFPNPNEKCKGLDVKRASKVLVEDYNLCKINYFDAINQPLYKIEDASSNNKTYLKSTKKYKLKSSNKKDDIKQIILGLSHVTPQKINEISLIQKEKNSNETDYSINKQENKVDEKLQHLKNLFLKNKIFRKKFELMNSDAHKIFKISYEEYIDYLISSHEKDLFENYPYPDVEFTFIYSNSFKTSAVRELRETNKSNKVMSEKTLKAIPGDQSIHAISSMYPGLNWLLLSLYDSKKHPYDKGIHFVEFCTNFEQKKNSNSSNSKVKFEHGKNQYIPLECECMGNNLKSNFNSDKTEDCNHSAMTNDKFLIKFLTDILTKREKGNIYEAKGGEFKELFNREFNDEMFCENFKDFFKDKQSKESNKN